MKTFVNQICKYGLGVGLYATFLASGLYGTTGTNLPIYTYSVDISSPTDGGTYEKGSGLTGSASAEEEEDDNGTITVTDITDNINWGGDVSGSGGTSSDFTTSLGAKSLTASAESASDSVTVDIVEITFNGPASTQDGASADFSVTVDPDDLSPTYKWSYTTPSGAGNLPSGGIFDDDTKSDPTVAKAWWFASPDDKGTAAPSCDYTIEVEIDFGVSKITKTQNWSVPITLDPNGNLGWVRRPFISGEPVYEIYADSDGDEYYRIKPGNGSLTRNTPTNNDIVITVLSSGQWADKTRKHEEEHVKQWSNGGWKDYYSVSVMRSRLNSVSDTYAPNSYGLSALRSEVLKEIADYNTLERRRGDDTSAQRESLARAAADSIDPPYDFSGQN